MDEEKVEKMRYFCQWKSRKKKCLQVADIIYEVECKHAVGICQEHFNMFCELQEKNKWNKAREKVGLKPLKRNN